MILSKGNIHHCQISRKILLEDKIIQKAYENHPTFNVYSTSYIIKSLVSCTIEQYFCFNTQQYLPQNSDEISSLQGTMYTTSVLRKWACKKGEKEKEKLNKLRTQIRECKSGTTKSRALLLSRSYKTEIQMFPQPKSLPSSNCQAIIHTI